MSNSYTNPVTPMLIGSPDYGQSNHLGELSNSPPLHMDTTNSFLINSASSPLTMPSPLQTANLTPSLQAHDDHSMHPQQLTPPHSPGDTFMIEDSTSGLRGIALNVSNYSDASSQQSQFMNQMSLYPGHHLHDTNMNDHTHIKRESPIDEQAFQSSTTTAAASSHHLGLAPSASSNAFSNTFSASLLAEQSTNRSPRQSILSTTNHYSIRATVANRFGAGPEGLGQNISSEDYSNNHHLGQASPARAHSPSIHTANGSILTSGGPSASAGRRTLSRSNSHNVFTSSDGSAMPANSRGTSGQSSPSRPVSGLKRKTSSTNLIQDLVVVKTEKPAAASASTKKGMGRKTKSDVSLLTSAERKQRRLQRKAELARVSRRKKKMNLAGMEERCKELRELIMKIEGVDPLEGVVIGTGGTGGGLGSPHGSAHNLVLTPSSSNNSLASLGKRSHTKDSSAMSDDDDNSDDHEDDDDEDGEDDDGEDDEDQVKNEDTDQDMISENPIVSQQRQHGRGFSSSTSAPHLAGLLSPSSTVGADSPVTSRRSSANAPNPNAPGGANFLSPTSATSVISPSSASSSTGVSSTSPPALSSPDQESPFDVRAFLPAAPETPPLPTSGWMHGLSRQHLPALHRHAQDTLRALDQTLKFDSFEKLLRWLVQQASLAQAGVTPHTLQTQQAAQAWLYLANQLDLSSMQTTALTNNYHPHQTFTQELDTLKQQILQFSTEFRSHISLLDTFQSNVENTIHQEAREKLTEWVQKNREWIRRETRGLPMATGLQSHDGGSIGSLSEPGGVVGGGLNDFTTDSGFGHDPHHHQMALDDGGYSHPSNYTEVSEPEVGLDRLGLHSPLHHQHPQLSPSPHQQLQDQQHVEFLGHGHSVHVHSNGVTDRASPTGMLHVFDHTSPHLGPTPTSGLNTVGFHLPPTSSPTMMQLSQVSNTMSDGLLFQTEDDLYHGS